MADAQDGDRQALALPQAEQMVLALDLADAIGAARIGVVGRMAAEVLAQRLDIAAPIDRLGAGEDVVRDAPAKQIDQRLHVAGPIGGVVEDHVEVAPVIRQRRRQGAGLGAIAMDPPSALGHRRLVAVDHRDLVPAPGEFEHQVQADVAIAAGDQHAHGRPPPNPPRLMVR